MLMKKLIPSIVLLIILTGLPLGCSKRPRDSAIAKNIQTKAAAAIETRDSEIQVVAQHGRVKITGVAKNSAAQQKLEGIATENPELRPLTIRPQLPAAGRVQSMMLLRG